MHCLDLSAMMVSRLSILSNQNHPFLPVPFRRKCQMNSQSYRATEVLVWGSESLWGQIVGLKNQKSSMNVAYLNLMYFDLALLKLAS